MYQNVYPRHRDVVALQIRPRVLVHSVLLFYLDLLIVSNTG